MATAVTGDMSLPDAQAAQLALASEVVAAVGDEHFSPTVSKGQLCCGKVLFVSERFVTFDIQ